MGETCFRNEGKTEDCGEVREDSNEAKNNDQFPSNNYMNIIALPFGLNEHHAFKISAPEEAKIGTKAHDYVQGVLETFL